MKYRYRTEDPLPFQYTDLEEVVKFALWDVYVYNHNRKLGLGFKGTEMTYMISIYCREEELKAFLGFIELWEFDDIYDIAKSFESHSSNGRSEFVVCSGPWEDINKNPYTEFPIAVKYVDRLNSNYSRNHVFADGSSNIDHRRYNQKHKLKRTINFL